MLRWLLSISLPLYVLDQITKWWVVGRFAPPDEYGHYEEIEVIPDFFWLHRLHNTGVAFGMFNGTVWANIVFGLVSCLAFAAVIFMWRKNAFPTWPGKLAAALLLSGVAGNLTDRLIHGYVVDFLRFNLRFMMWPSFNVADSCICVAAGLLFITAWQKSPEPTPNAAQPKGAE